MSGKRGKRGPQSDEEIAKAIENSVAPETVERWTSTGHAVLDAIKAKVASNEPIPLSWLAFSRTFSEWHADYLTATEAKK